VSIYEIDVETSKGEVRHMSEYRGKVILVVNTATKCGFAPQFKGLQTLHEQYEKMGLRVLGFPCNQFANQEPLEGEEIARQCENNHGITFPLYAKIDVRGKNTHPLFRYLTSKARGFLGTKAIKWNFTKFLIDRDGHVVKRFAPYVRPDQIEDYIKNLL
jgi:glutathione peroxidase